MKIGTAMGVRERKQPTPPNEKEPTTPIYSDEDENVDGIFRIGKAGNMNTRKKIYDTHMLHNKNAIVRESTNEPERLEYCVRSMLYKYRYKNRKDFYICKKSIIKKADNYDVKIKRLNKKLDL